MALKVEHKKNESREHYELKQIAKYMLWRLGYKYIATEVHGVYETNGREGNEKLIIDTVGIKTQGFYGGEIPLIKTMGIEAKASYSDFKNGYCKGCEYTYVIAPKGIIPINKLGKGIGLIEVDLDNYTIKNYYGKLTMEGIEISKQARSTLAIRFKDKEDRQEWATDIFRAICYRATVENLFENSMIEIK